jgi:glycerol-1-phosphate dehydrogenase [NAD(P)+]
MSVVRYLSISSILRLNMTSPANPLPSLERPTKDLVKFGSGILAFELAQLNAGFTLVSQEAPRNALDAEVLDRVGTFIDATALDADVLQDVLKIAPADQAVVGVGGGVVMDTAKWVGWSHHVPLYLAPSSISVDASVTNMVAVREGGVVRYQGFAIPKRVIVDVDIIRTAPIHLNRAGIGDLLSIHTGSFDWHLGAVAGTVNFDADVAEAAAAILEATIRAAEEIAVVSESGVVTLMSGYCEINDMTVTQGHAQMEEGSEHYFAYLAEQVTGRSFVHGELVVLGAVLMSRWQENDESLVLDAATRAKVRWQPEEIGLSSDELRTILYELPAFVVEMGLPYSVINERSLSTSEIGDVVKGLV